MQAFEFKAKVKDGTIQIPKKYTKQIGETVKVIVLADHKPDNDDMVDELLKHPVKIENFSPLKRDEIYEGH